MGVTTVRAVLFDAGNTLVHLDYAFIARVLVEAGYPRTPLAIRQAEYAAKAVLDREFAPARTPPETVEGLLWPDAATERPAYFATVLRRLDVLSGDIPPLLATLQAHNRAECLWRVIEPDTPDVLQVLRARGFALAVVSNADGRIEHDLGRRGLGVYFATVVDSHVVGVEKPARAIFDLALARLAVPAAAAVYVGDVFGIDVCGARGAGLAPVLLDPLGCYPGPVDCPRIRGLPELLDLLPATAAR